MSTTNAKTTAPASVPPVASNGRGAIVSVREFAIERHLIEPTENILSVSYTHLCEGWLEGYLLTGRHGVWSSYEAFAQVVDSMVTQHALSLIHI